MKIGIACYPTHGGSGVVATELGLALADRGHEVHLFSYSSPFRLRGFTRNLYFHEVEVTTYPLFRYPPYALSLAAKMAAVARESCLDIFHVHYAVPHAVSALLARQLTKECHTKILTTLHGTDITLVGRDESFFEVVKFSIEESDGVTAVSEYLRDKTVSEFGIRKAIHVIYNFVDTNRWNDEVNDSDRKQFAPNDERLIVHASNFRPLKRATDVVEIFYKVRQEIPARLLLVGEGPELPNVQQRAHKLRIDHDVLFLGTQDYIENIFSCADLFLLPSENESFGLAALEAMSCGCPVIGSNVGGLPEVVSNGETGHLLPVGDIDGMAAKALEILSSAKLKQTLSTNARRRAVERFDAERIVGQYVDLYDKLLRQ